jgi:hypothetical protein
VLDWCAHSRVLLDGASVLLALLDDLLSANGDGER